MVIVVVTFNRPEYMKMCVQSLYDTTPQDVKILVINNKSTDDTRKHIIDLTISCPGRVYLHDAETNLGCAGGRNRGWDVAHSMTDDDEYISMSDDDFWYNDGWYEVSRRALNQNPDVGLVTCHNDFVHPQFGDWELRGELEFRDSITTASCMIRKDCFRDVGGYKDRHKVLGWISRDFCRRMNESGHKVVRSLAGSRLVESMDHTHHHRNLRSRYEKSGYSYLRKVAKAGQLDIGDEELQNIYIEMGKRNPNERIFRAVDIDREGIKDGFSEEG